MTLVHAAMCEGIKDHRPSDEAIVFSIRLESIYCFTDFEPVPEKAVIYHKWFSRDKFRTEIMLPVKPARWSTFSKIRLLTGQIYLTVLIARLVGLQLVHRATR